MAKTPAAKQAPTPGAAGAAAFEPRFVHAYRRQPYMVPAPGGVGEVEKAVEVVFEGEKVFFKSNDAGHVVGLVKTHGMFKRLLKEIPEAYIEYKGGDNVPEVAVLVEPGTVKPEGEFVLSNGDAFVSLDDMSDEDVRDFAEEAGIEADALPEVLTGEDLKRAVYNQLQTV